MAYTLKVDGLKELSDLLDRMDRGVTAVAAKALYDGAGVMADEMNMGAEQIETAPFHYAVFVTRQPSPEEKEIVKNAAAGIAKFRKDGYDVDTSVGFRNAGYAMLKGKQVPIPKIVNAINSGTSFMQKQPFVRKAVRTGGPKAIEAMKKTIEAEFEAMDK